MQIQANASLPLRQNFQFHKILQNFVALKVILTQEAERIIEIFDQSDARFPALTIEQREEIETEICARLKDGDAYLRQWMWQIRNTYNKDDRLRYAGATLDCYCDCRPNRTAIKIIHLALLRQVEQN